MPVNSKKAVDRFTDERRYFNKPDDPVDLDGQSADPLSPMFTMNRQAPKTRRYGGTNADESLGDLDGMREWFSYNKFSGSFLSHRDADR